MNLVCMIDCSSIGESPDKAMIVGAAAPGEIGEIRIRSDPVMQGAEIELRSVSQDLSGKIAAYKAPRRLMVTEALPRTPIGDVTKHVLRDSFVDHEALRKVQPS